MLTRPTVEEMAVIAAICVLFFYGMNVSLTALKLPKTQVNSIISLVHHVGVTVYCLHFNYSFMPLLHSSFHSSVLPCDTSLFSTPQIYYSGIFTIVYLAFDMVLDLLPDISKNKLLIFHHINGVVLVSYALLTHHGEYMVYICHVMEISSIFLSLKDLLKYFGAPEVLKTVNDMAFALSFLSVRSYVTLASVFVITGMYSNGCLTLDSLRLLDCLIIYTTVLYVCLTSFWSYGIVRKVFRVLAGQKDPKAKKQL